MKYSALKREDIISVIEGKGAAERIPNLVQLWVKHNVFGQNSQEVLDMVNSYPMDVQRIRFMMPRVFDAPDDEPEYRWMNFNDPYKDTQMAIDEKIAINDWSQLKDVLEHFPSPEYTRLFPGNPKPDGRYRLGQWFFCFFERHWSLRGMTNALMDFYTNPKEVHQLYSALCDFYMRVIERAKGEVNIDGLFTSDDLGTQTGPFFSPEIFDEFFAPYYQRIINKAHEVGLHFWLHTCGNIELFIPKFIDLGLDVIHPIQKYTMDEKITAQKFGKDICILAGFDVQKIIPWGTTEEVRKEVRYLIDTYYRPDGRLMLTVGNAIKQDCPLESLEALLNEVLRYGTKNIIS